MLIRRAEPPACGSVFFQQDVLSIIATMPWLDRSLPHFSFSKAVDIQYPCELRNIETLASLAQGSRSKIAWEVRSSFRAYKCVTKKDNARCSTRAIRR